MTAKELEQFADVLEAINGLPDSDWCEVWIDARRLKEFVQAVQDEEIAPHYERGEGDKDRKQSGIRLG